MPCSGFLYRPGLEATNWRAEQAIRPMVVTRKVWGGNRTPAGAKTQSILLSILQTGRNRHVSYFLMYFLTFMVVVSAPYTLPMASAATPCVPVKGLSSAAAAGMNA